MAGPGRGASAEARGVSAGSAVPVRRSAARRLREAPGFPSGVWGRGKRRPRAPPAPAQPGRLGAQRSGRAPPGRGRRAQSWATGTVTSARRILCCARLRSGGSPGPAARGPRPGRLDPTPAAGTKGNKTASNPPSRFRRDFTRRGREVGLWGGGARADAPAPAGPQPRPGQRRQGFPASPSAASPAPSAPPAPPSEVTETFSCSGRGGEPLPALGGGVRGGSRGAEAAAAGH